MQQPEFLTAQQLVERWNGAVTKGTLANWRSTGKRGPRFTKIGGRVLYKMDAVLEYEASQLRGAANDNNGAANAAA